MPAILNTRSDEERQLRIRVATDYTELTGTVGAALAAHAQMREATVKLAALRASRSPVQSVLADVKWLLLLMGISAAYIIDVLMVGSAADYLAANTLGDYPRLMQSARFVLPIAVIAFELCIAFAVAEARENAAVGLGS